MAGEGTSVAGPPLKVVVVVHGIGDQTPFETVHAVVRACFGVVGRPQAVPLGDLHTRLSQGEWADGYRELPGLAFAEAHWADIARAREEYTLEGTPRWIESVVERLRLQDGRYKPLTGRVREIPYDLVRRELRDAVRVIRLLGLLNRLLARLELGSVPLDRVLTSFLGDVQLFSEFGVYRRQFVERFMNVVEKIDERATRERKDVEIHVVGHSQGSAIAFLGILEARAAGRPWVSRLASLTTLGSPIDKFVALWSPIWGDFFRVPTPDAPTPGARWLNYVDLGDPVGDRVDLGGDLVQRTAPGLFAGDRAEEHEFARYPVPGKAHTDYFLDPPLWEHWLAHAIGWPEPAAPASPPPPPPSRAGPKILAPVLTYLVPVAVLAAAGGAACRGAAVMAGASFSLRHAAGISALLVGATVLGAVTRLTPRWWWYLLAAAGMAGGAGSFLAAFSPSGTAWPPDASGAAWWIAAAAAGGAVFQNLADALVPRRHTFLAHVVLAATVLGVALSNGWVRPTPGGFFWFGLALVLWALGTLGWGFAVIWQTYVRRGAHVEFLRERWRSRLADPVERTRPPPPVPAAPPPTA